MELLARFCLFSLETILLFCLIHYECRKLDVYNFPVYPTEFCPRNQTEWNERSSAINCNESNGYLCLPNKDLTELFEFCYTSRFIWIQEDICLYLYKSVSGVGSYSCRHFLSGCSSYSFPSNKLFEHPSCTSIGNGCFLAEPSCKSNEMYIQETTERIHIQNDTTNLLNNSTTQFPEETTEQKYMENDPISYTNVLLVILLFCFVVFVCVVCGLGIYHRKGNQICKRRGRDEENIDKHELVLFIQGPESTGNDHTFNALQERNSQCKVRHCSNCSSNADFLCKTCPCELCFHCKEKHFYELVTKEHVIVTFYEKNFIDKQVIKNHKKFRFCKRRRPHTQTEWERKKQLICGTINNIRSEDLFYRRAMLTRIKSDFQECKMDFSKIHSQMLEQAQKQIMSPHDDLINYKVTNAIRIIKKKLLKRKFKLKVFLKINQKYELIYEHSSLMALEFIALKQTSLSQKNCNFHFPSHVKLSINDSLNKKDVANLFSNQIKDGRKRGVRNDFLLEVDPCPIRHASFKVNNVRRCDHISCFTLDCVWVSDRSDLILLNSKGDVLHNINDICDLRRGIHTVNRNNEELIYIDKDYNIKKLLTDKKTKENFVEKSDHIWRPQCVYYSTSTNDLIVGMQRKDKRTGKVVRYNQSGELTQTIDHINTGMELYSEPRYITENNNGDIVVSDYGVVVVTDSGGSHRFSYRGHPPGSLFSPHGICTDVLSHIIICEELTNTVQVISRNGTFLLILQGLVSRRSLSYDSITHRLWVGSDDDGEVCVFTFLLRNDPDELHYGNGSILSI